VGLRMPLVIRRSMASLNQRNDKYKKCKNSEVIRDDKKGGSQVSIESVGKWMVEQLQ